MEQKKYKIEGMHCASCAGIIERTLSKNEGVISADVNYGTEMLSIKTDDSIKDISQLVGKIETLGYSLVDVISQEKNTSVTQKNSKFSLLKKMKNEVLLTIPLAVFATLAMTWDILVQYNVAPEMGVLLKNFITNTLPLVATYMLFVVGKPYLKGIVRFIKHGKANMDTLIGIGTVTAFVYSFIVSIFRDILAPYIDVSHTYYDVTIVVIAFITLGKYLEYRSKIKTGDAIEKLLGLQAKTALVLKGNKEVEINITEVQHGDLIIVKPGSKIPVDGTVTEGSSFVDESMITGEPMAVKKSRGESVVAGTINTNGSFIFATTKIGSETMLSQIIQMVEEAQGTKAPIQALADKISAIFVPIVLIIAVLSLTLWLTFGSGPLGFSQALSFGIVSFVGVLIIACPCALGLATPTAIIVGVGKGAKEGILIKDAATLEKLHKIDTVIVDKTGTITIGKPTLVNVDISSGMSENDFLSILATLESKSEHPIATAIIKHTSENNIKIQNISDFKNIQGKGIHGVINSTEYYAGNIRLIKELGIPFDTSNIEIFTSQGKTPVILATKSTVLGFIMVADEIKTGSVEAIKNLHNLGIKVIMVTGDDLHAAQHIASIVNIDEVIAQALPQDKLLKIKELQAAGHIVAMAGDGVNDAPALAQADVGIAMGTGTDVAIESAGITLLGGDISKLVKAVRLSKITMRGIKQNLFWAFIYNIIGIPLAAGFFYPIFGWLLNPVFAGLAMALSSVSVVSNSLRIKTKKI